jgi:hypothetical protein
MHGYFRKWGNHRESEVVSIKGGGIIRTGLGQQHQGRSFFL